MHFPIKRLVALGLIVCLEFPARSDSIRKSVQIQTTTVAQNKASQKKIDRLAEETDNMLDQYRQVVSESEALKKYNDQVEQLLASQVTELSSIRNQIEGVETTNQRVIPLMLKMIDALERFVDLDVPFLLEERRARVSSLKELMKRADVSTSEKYRRVMEAYQIENEYGRSIEAYSNDVTVEGQTLTVDFLRLGRVVLVYQTLDQKSAKIWSQINRAWEDLDSSYIPSIKEGLKIARKQAAPNLLTIPVMSPARAQ